MAGLVTPGHVIAQLLGEARDLYTKGRWRFRPSEENYWRFESEFTTTAPQTIPSPRGERSVGLTVKSESALGTAQTHLSPVRVPPPSPWPGGWPESLRSPY
ncbi:hypothetical protein PoB_007144900 [Plakobranchus ocellatus]|uniref:Uncharacterized protein n=1 Tax=Plakobranchus ocellatus TaxID=259542 RepID=A0AAV4DL54_9GAST|nr:hypothetical protein PoB_007144900 [Plakobranchus ocellatus]